MQKLENIIITIVTSSLLTAGATAHAQLADLSVSSIQPQPQAQMLEIGSGITFSVDPSYGSSFQWLCNGVPIANQTNYSITIQDAQIADAGYYSCNISSGLNTLSAFAATPSTTVSLMVFNFTPNMDVVVYATPVVSNGSQGSCPGAYKGYVNYIKTAQQGWGWVPLTNTTVFTATDNNRSDTKVYYTGDYGDSGCAKTSVTIPNSPFSDAYRFSIFFTNNVPTTNYPITLSGFNP